MRRLKPAFLSPTDGALDTAQSIDIINHLFVFVESDLATFPALAKGEGMESRKRRLLALRTASSKLEAAFEVNLI